MSNKEKNWNDNMISLLNRKQWDYKDWHRALSCNQWELEALINSNTSTVNQEVLESILEETRTAKTDKNMMRFSSPVIIVVWAHKGGTGKSTIASNMSYILAQRGYNVLAIDTDSQSDLSAVLYPTYIVDGAKNFYEALSFRDDFVEEGYISHTEYLNLDVIPGSAKSEGLEAILSATDPDIRNKIWPKCLKGCLKDNYYDFIIIDMDKTAGTMNTLALTEADYVVSPIDLTQFAVKSIPTVLAQIENVKKMNPRLHLLGILYNKVDNRKKRAIDDSNDLVSSLAKESIFTTYINMDSSIDNSQRDMMPLGEYQKSSRGNKQLNAFVDEMLERVRYISDKVVK